jgi:hypothetical protein
MVTESAANGLRNYLEQKILEYVFPRPALSEGEPAYTARILKPFIEFAIDQRVSSRHIHVYGDGAKVRAYAKAILGLKFYPDIAVLEQTDKVWCAEVKLAKTSLIGDVLAKALGQALIYHQVYPFVTVVILRYDLAGKGHQNTSTVLENWLNVIEVKNFE